MSSELNTPRRQVVIVKSKVPNSACSLSSKASPVNLSVDNVRALFNQKNFRPGLKSLPPADLAPEPGFESTDGGPHFETPSFDFDDFTIQHEIEASRGPKTVVQSDSSDDVLLIDASSIVTPSQGPKAQAPKRKRTAKSTAKATTTDVKETARAAGDWTNEQTLELITKYREYAFLYDLKHPYYHNKMKRSVTMDDIVVYLSRFRPGTKVEQVKAKLNILRTSFSKEYAAKLKLETERSGMSSDDSQKYIPKMLFFEDLLFLADHVTPRKSSCSLSIGESSSSGPSSSTDDRTGDEASSRSASISSSDENGAIDEMIADEEAQEGNSNANPKKKTKANSKKKSDPDEELTQLLRTTGALMGNIVSKQGTAPAPSNQPKPGKYDNLAQYLVSTLNSLEPEKAKLLEQKVLNAILSTF